MFEREHHIRIAAILQALDPDKLTPRGCLFGGGTAIALSHSEFRESRDIDFLISDRAGFRTLRSEITSQGNLHAISRKSSKLTLATEVRTDQYGIRTLINIAGIEIKFEIVLEGRIQLDRPKLKDQICGIAVLTAVDMAATKLLANSDRWSDDSVFSRDLIDLAMLKPSRLLITRAIKKAETAYGENIKKDLGKAVQRLKERPGRLDECMIALKTNSIPKAVLWKRIRSLATLIR